MLAFFASLFHRTQNGKCIKNLDKVAVRVKFIRIMCVYCFRWCVAVAVAILHVLSLPALSDRFQNVSIEYRYSRQEPFCFDLNFTREAIQIRRCGNRRGLRLASFSCQRESSMNSKLFEMVVFFHLLFPLLRLVKEHLRRAARINKRSGDTGMRRFGAHT